MKIFLTFLLIFLTGCSLYKQEIKFPYNHKRAFTKEDYGSHLYKLSMQYIENNTKKILKIKLNESTYLRKLYRRIKENNERTLTSSTEPTIYIISDKRSYYFSIPGGLYFFSSSLFKKYLKSEGMFVSILASEMIRNEYLIYNKQKKFLFSDISIKELIKTTYIKLQNRNRVNKITYEMMKRSGYDPSGLLLWIQLKNRNTVEFNFQYDNIGVVSKEEYYIKNYIVRNKKTDNELYEKNSSKDFYKFKNFLRKRWK